MKLAKIEVYKYQVLPRVNINEHFLPVLARVRPDTLSTMLMTPRFVSPA